MPAWLERLLPDFIARFLERLSSPESLIVVAIVSGVALLASLIGVPLFLARLPADYFSRRDRTPAPEKRSPGRVALMIVRNALGATALVLGVLMLVLPGQGILTIVVGLLLLDFPGKRKFESRLVGRPSVLRAINALRRRMGRPPFDRRPSWH